MLTSLMIIFLTLPGLLIYPQALTDHPIFFFSDFLTSLALISTQKAFKGQYQATRGLAFI